MPRKTNRKPATRSKGKSKAKGSPKAEKHRSGALVSSAAILTATGYSKAVLSDLQGQGVIKPAERGYWNALETLGAMIRKLRLKESGSEDRQRKNKAEADSAELDALIAAGKTCRMIDAKLFWSDARIEVRQLIEGADFLTPAQKVKLLARIAELKLKQPDVAA